MKSALEQLNSKHVKTKKIVVAEENKEVLAFYKKISFLKKA